MELDNKLIEVTKRDCIHSSSNRKYLIKHYPSDKSQVNHKFNIHNTYEIKTNMVILMVLANCFLHISFFLSALCTDVNWWECCDYWIGGNDFDEEGTFIWTSDNTTLDFVNWNTGEPNNSNGNQDCVSICQNKHWRDRYCHDVLSYICKAPAI